MGRNQLARLIVLATFASLVGCAGKARLASKPEPPPPPSPTEPASSDAHVPLTDLDALVHDFELSSRRLDEQLTLRASYRDRPPPPGIPPIRPVGPDPKTPPGPDRPPDAIPLGKRQVAPRGSPCDLACRALASMRRSAAGICRLTSDHDERCTSARRRVRQAAQRVQRAGCECIEP